jgi:hypothetical protein
MITFACVPSLYTFNWVPICGNALLIILGRDDCTKDRVLLVALLWYYGVIVLIEDLLRLREGVADISVELDVAGT